MRVVNTDNFNSDYPDESFVVGGSLTQKGAEALAELLNMDAGPNAPRYFKVVPDDYQLQPGFEP